MLVLVRKRNKIWEVRILVVFLDDDDCIGYLNDWDKKLPNLDVVDDYRNEKKEIQARQGKQFPFSFGDVSIEFERFFLFSII